MSHRLSAMPEMIWKAIASFGLRFVALGLQFLGSIMIARALGAESFGAYIFAYTCASLAGACLSLGMAELSVREVPIFAEYKNRAGLRRYFQVQLGTIAAMACVVALGFFLLEQFGVLTLAPGWALVTIFALANVLVLAAEKNMAGFQRIVTARLFDSILRPALYVLTVAAFLFWGQALSPTQLLVIATFAALAAAIAMWSWVARLVKTLPQSGRQSDDTAQHRRWWYIASIPMMLTTMINMLLMDMDVIMIGLFLGDGEVGIYRPAVRGVALVNLANLAAVQTLGPMLARALARQDTKGAQVLMGQAVTITAALGLAICVALAFGGDFYLGLFGDDFRAARPALITLIAGQACAILGGGAGAVLVMLKRERWVLGINVAAIALNIGLNIFLIPIWGLQGAACATALSLVSAKIALVVCVRQLSDFDPTIVFPLKRLLARTRPGS